MDNQDFQTSRAPDENSHPEFWRCRVAISTSNRWCRDVRNLFAPRDLQPFLISDSVLPQLWILLYWLVNLFRFKAGVDPKPDMIDPDQIDCIVDVIDDQFEVDNVLAHENSNAVAPVTQPAAAYAFMISLATLRG